MVARALESLLGGVVDFAGLYPPAALDMGAAVRAYAAYRRGSRAWMLGRFVVPSARLAELEAAAAAARVLDDGPGPWLVVATGSAAADADLEQIRAFSARQPPDGSARLTVDTYENRVSTAGDVSRLAEASRGAWRVACEVPFAGSAADSIVALDELLAAIRMVGGIAKARTGGVTPEAIPDGHAVARFLYRCARIGVPMKATAGLHHPIRARHRLTYAPDSPTAVMHGFLNVFAAAAFAPALVRTEPEESATRALTDILDETDPGAFVFDDESLRWRDLRVGFEAIEAVRASGALSFGSCSFEEPVDDLRRLGHEL